MLTTFFRFILAPLLLLWSAFCSLWTSEKTSTPNKTHRQRLQEETTPIPDLKVEQPTATEDTTPSSPLDENETFENMSNTLLNAMEKDKNWAQRLNNKKSVPKVEIPRGYGKKIVENRWKILLEQNEKYTEYVKEQQKRELSLSDQFVTDIRKELYDDVSSERVDLFKDNVENFIGTVKIPLGVAGPVRVNGLHAQGDYYIPLATTEAALVASISRGISCINQSGGSVAAVFQEGVNRDPCFQFNNLIEVATFLSWAKKNHSTFKQEAEKSTRHGKLVDIKYLVEARDVHMKCSYASGDASGQNMVTIATEHIYNYILNNSPVKPRTHFIEGGMSGDKKGNIGVMTGVRGRRVIVECTIPKAVIETTLHVTPLQLANSTQVGIRGLFMNGSIGLSCHFSNAITAMAIAMGQDPACAAEAHVGIARCEVNEDGDIYIAATLPNILCATVGGGTKLPSQRACLELMGLYGPNKANALAEVMATVVIAGELSLGAAIISGDFAKAHKILARDTSQPINLEVDTIDDAFDKAQAMVVKLSSIPPKSDILQIYGLYKQSTVGDVNITKPSFWSPDLKAKAKYSAWESKKGMKKSDAKKAYVELVQKLVAADKQQ